MRCPSRLSVSLLGLLMLPACGQSSLPPGVLTPESLTRFCAEQGASCQVQIAGHSTLELRGDWQLPASWRVHFTAGSSLLVTGAVLDFHGGAVDAPASEWIFPDPDRVRGLSLARPEWFGPTTAGTPEPATALAAAYEATVPWGTIYLQARRYLSPFTDCPATPLRWFSPRTLVGAGRPEPDSPEEPSRLQNGTILLGGIRGTAPVRLAHLGIDAGPETAAHALYGCEPPGVFIEQPANHRFVSGDRLEDVSVLTTGAKDMHSVMIAGHRDTLIRDLKIWTLGGLHGLVMKSEDSTIDGFYCRGALADCLIVKSDYATDFLGRANHNRVAHVDIAPLRPDGYVGGIMVESRWDTVRDLEMTDIHQTGSHYSLILLGSNLYHPEDIRIRNWTADSAGGACLLSNRAAQVSVSGFRCNLRRDSQAGAYLIGGKDIHLEAGTIRCTDTPAACIASPMDGVFDDSHGLSMQGVSAEGLSGYLVRGTGPSPDLRSSRIVDMGNRLYLHVRLPLRRRLGDAQAEIKPSLRILYTKVMVRLYYQPRRYAAAAFVTLLLVFSSFLLLRHRRKSLTVQTT